MPNSGFSYSFELEMRFAAQWAGYKWQEFLALDGYEQDAILATYEAKHRIDAINSYESSKRMKRK